MKNTIIDFDDCTIDLSKVQYTSPYEKNETGRIFYIILMSDVKVTFYESDPNSNGREDFIKLWKEAMNQTE